jgi:hypothetical protein
MGLTLTAKSSVNTKDPPLRAGLSTSIKKENYFFFFFTTFLGAAFFGAGFLGAAAFFGAGFATGAIGFVFNFGAGETPSAMSLKPLSAVIFATVFALI